MMGSTTRRRAAVVALAALGALAPALSVVTPAGAATPTSPAVLYAGPAQTGDALPLPLTHDVPDLAQFGFDDRAVSVSLGRAHELSLYQHRDYQGTCLDVRGDLADLTTTALAHDVTSVRVGQSCQTRPTSASVTLYADDGGQGAALKLTEDVPDLAAVGFGERASSVLLSGASAAALYSDPGYAGRCETVLPGQTQSLVASTVGNDTLSSLRIGSTCFGPVDHEPVVQDVTVVKNTAACPSGYTHEAQDLNQGAGGDYLYLCVAYAPFHPGSWYVSDGNVLSYYTAADALQRYVDCQTFVDDPDNRLHLVDVDLDSGTGAPGVLYLCLNETKVADQSALATSRGPLADIGAGVFGWGDDPSTGCSRLMRGSGNYVGTVTGLAGDTIWICDRNVDTPTLESAAPRIAAPSSLTGTLAPGDSRLTLRFRVDALGADGQSVPSECSFAAALGDLQTLQAPAGDSTIECDAYDPSTGATSSVTIPVHVLAADTTPPTIVASASVAEHPYTAGTWTRGPVDVTFGCTDGGSGVASQPQPVSVSAEGAQQSAQATCTDRAGNSATATFSGIDIDRTAPGIRGSLRLQRHKSAYLLSARITTSDAQEGTAGVTVRLVKVEQADVRRGKAPVWHAATGASGFAIGTADFSGQVRPASTARTYRLTYAATDRAGNVRTLVLSATTPAIRKH